MAQRTLLLFVVILITSSLLAQQKQEEEAPFYYQVKGLVYVYNYNITTRTAVNTQKVPKPPLKFEIVRNEKDANGRDFCIIKFLPITSDDVTVGKAKVNLTGNATYINSSDNDDYFWIFRDDLDALVEDKKIVKSFTLTRDVAYGANVSLPFKLRPSVGDQNIRLTPDITIGGYLGIKHRISRSKEFYVTAPVVTLGLATLPVTDETDGTNPDIGDGMVLGVTASTGVVFQLRDFQLGFMMGWDRAAGELGKTWIYNNLPWYSFSIGFTFFGNTNNRNN